MVLFQNGDRQLRSPAKMAATVQLRCYQNMPNLNNRYKSAERNILKKNRTYAKLLLAM
jgi:hypothetical protein